MDFDFDVQLLAVVRVKANDEDEARRQAEDALDAANICKDLPNEVKLLSVSQEGDLILL